MGCGSGALTIACAKRNPKAHFTGVDRWGKEYADYSQALCFRNTMAEGVNNAFFRPGDANALPFADETFDAVLIANALHIMPRPEKALAEIYRVLKPGGQLFAPTFVHGEVPRTRLRMLAMRCAGLQIYNSWMVPQYLAFLQAGGFAVQEHALLGDTLAPLCYARAVPDKTRVTQR